MSANPRNPVASRTFSNTCLTIYAADNTLGMCVHALFWEQSRPKKDYNWPFIVVTALTFVFTTFDVGCTLRHNMDAFIYYKGPGGPNAEFEDISNVVNVMIVSACNPLFHL
jgi:hypothetical protein